jgi:hypothetical protein
VIVRRRQAAWREEVVEGPGAVLARTDEAKEKILALRILSC